MELSERDYIEASTKVMVAWKIIETAQKFNDLAKLCTELNKDKEEIEKNAYVAKVLTELAFEISDDIGEQESSEEVAEE